MHRDVSNRGGFEQGISAQQMIIFKQVDGFVVYDAYASDNGLLVIISLVFRTQLRRSFNMTIKRKVWLKISSLTTNYNILGNMKG